MWGQALAIAGGLVSPAIDAFRGSSSAEKAYERFLKSKGMSDADIRSQVSQTAGLQADKADLAKQGVMGNLQGQGLGNSIIGAQAGMKLDIEKNKMIDARMNQLNNANLQEKMRRDEMFANYRLDRDQAKRQGQSDFWGGALGGGGKLLTSWLSKQNKNSTSSSAG